MGKPGKYSKVDVTMKKSSPTLTIDGSGLNPVRTGFLCEGIEIV